MWTWIVNFLTGGFVQQIASAYVAAKQTDGAVDIAAIEAATASVRAQAEIIKAEQGAFLTRLVRPMFALPVAIYYAKLWLWDKVLGLGSTDPVSPEMSHIAMIVIGSYFGVQMVENVASKFTRNR